jgi:hypothetical protein
MTTQMRPPVIPAQGGRTLAELDETERYQRFDHLQGRMASVWESVSLDVADESVVVVPSLSLARTTATSGTLAQAMEERALFLLLLLRQPHLQMVFVTSMPVSEAVVEYYLGLLPGVITQHARARLQFVSVGDSSADPLSQKLLDRPRLLRRIRAMVPAPAHSHLIPFNTTALERDVAISLGIPMYGADPRFEPLGSKTGCRRLFNELGVACPLGAEDLHSVSELVDEVVRMRSQRPGLSEIIVKLNEGVSGSGNAGVTLAGLPEPGSDAEREAVATRIRSLSPEDETTDPAALLAAFAADGGIVEERITGVGLTSPSVQMRVLPDKTVELLSTHDQLLGGPSGQSYLGCVFPADPAYSRLITEPAMTIGRRLADLGVLGRFAVDFVVVMDATGAWTPYAIELNLRKGGTTHPFLTLQFLTDGTYDADTGVFRTAGGNPKHLVATDHLEHAALKALTVEDLFHIVVTRRLHFDHSHQTGVVLHMLRSLTEAGRVGLTAVGNSPEHAKEIYERASRIIVEEAKVALAQAPVLH